MCTVANGRKIKRRRRQSSLGPRKVGLVESQNHREAQGLAWHSPRPHLLISYHSLTIVNYHVIVTIYSLSVKMVNAALPTTLPRVSYLRAHLGRGPLDKRPSATRCINAEFRIEGGAMGL